MMIVDVFGNAAEPRWRPDEPMPWASTSV